jgi:hypothetical protein
MMWQGVLRNRREIWTGNSSDSDYSKKRAKVNRLFILAENPAFSNRNKFLCP